MNGLLNKTLLYTIGTAASKLISAAIIPIYALYVSSEALGSYDYVLTFAGIACPICFLAIWEAVLRFALTDNCESRDDCIASIAKFCGILLCLSLGVFLLLSLSFADFRLEIVSIAAMTMLNGFAQVWQYFSRALGRTKVFVLSGVLSTVLNFASIVILVCCLNIQFFGLVIAYCVGQLTILITIEAQCRIVPTALRKRLNIKTIKRALRFSVPLIFNLVVSLVLVGFGRILIVTTLGPEENGAYVFAMKFASLVIAVGSAFSMAAIEEAILRIGQDGFGRYFASVIEGLWLVLLSVCIAMLPAVCLFYLWVPGVDYRGSLDLIPLFLLYACFSILSTNYGNAFQVTLTTKYAAFTTFAGMAISVSASLLLIGTFSVIGVAFSLTLGMLTVMILRLIASRRLIDYTVSKKPFLLFVVFIAESGLLFSFNLESQLVVLIPVCIVAILFALKPFFSGVKILKSIKDSSVMS